MLVSLKNTSIVALDEQTMQMRNGDTRRKLEITCTEQTRDGMLLVGGIEVWDDTIDKMGLFVGQQLEELKLRVTSRSANGKWWWSVQAYAAIPSTNNQQQEDAQAF